jgi:mannose-6-phosphate isomerase
LDLEKIASLPVFFNKNRVFRVYLGGKLFSEFFGDESEDCFYPEEWICSTVTALNEGSDDPFEGLSVIKDTDIHFNELLKHHKDLLLGNRNGLDVLVKALDSAIRLPVQAHPDKAFSKKHFNSSFGKAESWYILATRENAAIYFGFKTGVTREDFEKAIEDSATDKSAMEKLLNRIPVKDGDVYFIPARAVHAIGAGCLVLEVQEPTDFTIQPEHWCGDYRLSEKEMYLGLDKNTALDCFDFSFGLKDVELKCKKTPETIEAKGGFTKQSLISKKDTPCFSVMRYSINHDKSSFFEAPAVYVVTSGAGTLKILGKDYSKDIKKGDTFFAPYILNSKLYVESDESVEVVSCLPPV